MLVRKDRPQAGLVVRRVQAAGPGSRTIVLPKAWTARFGITPGSVVDVAFFDKILIVVPAGEGFAQLQLLVQAAETRGP